MVWRGCYKRDAPLCYAIAEIKIPIDYYIHFKLHLRVTRCVFLGAVVGKRKNQLHISRGILHRR